jgi:hypothetical protein
LFQGLLSLLRFSHGEPVLCEDCSEKGTSVRVVVYDQDACFRLDNSAPAVARIPVRVLDPMRPVKQWEPGIRTASQAVIGIPFAWIQGIQVGNRKVRS